MKHGTPKAVVDLITKHIPASSVSILEPAVGKGALLAPLLSKRLKSLKHLTAIDIDKTRLSESKQLLAALGVVKQFENSDYLSWKGRKHCDCIIMNPPFNAKQKHCVSYEGLRIPIEAAFLLKSMTELRKSGTLIAILPASIISGKNLTFVRQRLIENFSIKRVYELNKFSFPGIEGTFYVLIAKKGGNTKRLHLEKPFSEKSVSIKFNSENISGQNYRLDFSYQLALIQLEQIQSSSDLSFDTLSEIASIDRGAISAPHIDEHILHTNKWRNGVWTAPNFPFCTTNNPTTNENDILVKRVSRNCHTTFGIYDGRSAAYSDCILRIRPKYEMPALELLFSIRTIYSGVIGQHALVRGTGAKFITAESLSKINVPVNLASVFSYEFSNYCKAINHNDYMASNNIEEKVLHQLLGAS